MRKSCIERVRRKAAVPRAPVWLDRAKICAIIHSLCIMELVHRELSTGFAQQVITVCRERDIAERLQPVRHVRRSRQHACHCRAGKQLADVELFDIYRSEAIGAGKKSMAFTLHFAPENKALEAADVDRFVKKILGNLKFKLGIEIR